MRACPRADGEATGRPEVSPSGGLPREDVCPGLEEEDERLDLRHVEGPSVRLSEKRWRGQSEGQRTHTWISGISVSARRLGREGSCARVRAHIHRVLPHPAELRCLGEDKR